MEPGCTTGELTDSGRGADFVKKRETSATDRDLLPPDAEAVPRSVRTAGWAHPDDGRATLATVDRPIVSEMTALSGDRVRLRPAVDGDVDLLVAIRLTPEVRRRWRGDDIEREVRAAISSDELHVLVIEDASSGGVLGAIQWAAEDDPDYLHAGIDMYLHPDVHGRGFGTDAARTLCRHLFDDVGHHRLTIDPAADNRAAIRCYENVGFRRVGVMREYERGADGTFHDGLLMELLRTDLTT
jgi:aminoglycoside 6'-N-acetyltransferase